MINVKDQVYAKLCAVDSDLEVSDVYPSDWSHDYTVQYMEEDNSVAEWVDDKESISFVRYTIYAWSNNSLSTLCLAIDEQLATLGLKRTSCTDANDPSGRRHKVMRYEAYIDNDVFERVYHNVNRN